MSPLAMASVASSSLRTGRSTQPETGQATAISAASGTTPRPASCPQVARTVDRVRSVGETVTTTPTTSLSRPTGSATISGRLSHGHRTAGGSGRYPARASLMMADISG